MMDIVIFNTDAVLFDITKDGKTYHFEVTNQLLEQLAHFHPDEASEELDYGAVFEDNIERFHAVANDLMNDNPSENYAINISEENFHH